MKNTERLNFILTSSFVGIDTASWIVDPLERQTAFLENLKQALDETKTVIWTTSHCIAELKDMLSDPDLQEAARRALAFIEETQASDKIVVYECGPVDQEKKAFADPTFLSALLRNRTEAHVSLITQDGDLAANAIKLETFDSVRGGRIFVYRVDGYGWPVRYNLFRTTDGEEISPKRSGLRCRWGTPMADVGNEDRPVSNHHEQEILWSSHGTVYTLEQNLASGKDSDVYTVQNMPELVIKVFHAPSKNKEAKCKLLTTSDFSPWQAVMPLDVLYNKDGDFCGITMQRVHGCTLEELLTENGRYQYAAGWDRLDFARLALQITEVVTNLNIGGLKLMDLHPANFIVGNNLPTGKRDPLSVRVLDLDSAQFGNEETGIFAADPIDVNYAAPEYLRGGLDLAERFSNATWMYHLSLLVFRCVMAGLHPFESATGRNITVEQAIVDGTFPYGSGHNLHGVYPPEAGSKLWSNMSSGLKAFFSRIFTQGDQYNAFKDRPAVFALIKELKNYINWLRKEEVIARYPEVRSLTPFRNKPYYATCANKSCKDKTREFVIRHYRPDGRYFCPQCWEDEQNRRNAFRETKVVHPDVVIPFPVMKEPAALPAPSKSFVARAREFCARLFA